MCERHGACPIFKRSSQWGAKLIICLLERFSIECPQKNQSNSQRPITTKENNTFNWWEQSRNREDWFLFGSWFSVVSSSECEVWGYAIRSVVNWFATVFYPICCDLFTRSLLLFGFILQLVTKALNMETWRFLSFPQTVCKLVYYQYAGGKPQT